MKLVFGLGVLFLGGMVACGDSSSGSHAAPQPQNDVINATRHSLSATGNVLANDQDPDGSSLYVASWTQGAKGDVQYAGNGVFTWEPRAGIASGTDSFRYTVANAAGVTAEATVNVNIAPGWGTANLLSRSLTRPEGTLNLITTAQGTDGTLGLIWRHTLGLYTQLWGARRNVDGSWVSPIRLDSPDLGSVFDSSLVVDNQGKITVIWAQEGADGAQESQVLAKQLGGDGNWSATSRVGTGATKATSSLRALADSQGKVRAFFFDQNKNILFNSMAADGQWGQSSQTNICASAASTNCCSNLRGAFIDTAGNVSLVCTAGFYALSKLVAADGTWGSSVDVGYDNRSGADILKMIADKSGNLTVFWRAAGELWCRGTSSAGNWWSPTKLSSSSNYSSLKVIASSTNTIYAVWEDSGSTAGINDIKIASIGANGVSKITPTGAVGAIDFALVDNAESITFIFHSHENDHYSLHAAHYEETTEEWTKTQISNPGVQGEPYEVSAVVDPSGTITALWSQFGIIWTNRTSGKSSWGVATKIRNSDVRDAIAPRVVVDSSGVVTAIFIKNVTPDYGSPYELWSNQYQSGAWQIAARLPSQYGFSDAQLLMLNQTPVVIATENDGALWSTDLR